MSVLITNSAAKNVTGGNSRWIGSQTKTINVTNRTSGPLIMGICKNINSTISMMLLYIMYD